MKKINRITLLFGMMLLILSSAAVAEHHGNPCNPCGGMKMEPHGNPCNPCGGMKMEPHGNPCNPCGMKKAQNPCMAKASSELAKKVTRPIDTHLWNSMWTSQETLVREGEALFNDTSLSRNGMACSTCHTNDALFKSSFAQPYPHYITMADQRAGMKLVNADEIVQFCIAVPMEGDLLNWEGRELAALTAYVVEVKQKNFMEQHAANPCAMTMNKVHMNPCNPCAKH